LEIGPTNQNDRITTIPIAFLIALGTERKEERIGEVRERGEGASGQVGEVPYVLVGTKEVF